MWNYEKRLQYPIKIKQTNPALAAMIISQYGGPDGEVVAFQQGAATGAGKSGDTWSVCQCDFCHFGRFEEQ